MLTKADDFPLHQRPEPIAFAGTDRNFYDRYFFNGQSADGGLFLAAALGVYPHLNLMDAAFSVLKDGEQRSVFASRALYHERMDTSVGPITVVVEEPLHRLRVRVEDSDGLSADIGFTGLHHPMLEPRFTHRIGARTLMDVTRMTVNVALSGSLMIDGVAIALDGWRGTRDRSWGIRPIGAADAQPHAPPILPQFFWIWAPLHFGAFSLYVHTNDDADGMAWNRSAVLVDHESGAETRLRDIGFDLDFQPGSRTARGAAIRATLPDGRPLIAVLKPDGRFHMHGIGYSHPERGHGSYHGELSVAQQRFAARSADLAAPGNAHVQALVAAECRIGDAPPVSGRGVLEQLFIGPHAPSGFAALYDLA